MKKMTKTWKNCFSRDKHHMINVKKVLEIKENNCNIKDMLREKYKNILGSKEPIVVLQKYLIPHACNKDYKSSKQSKSMYLTKDTLCNKKIILPQNKTVKTKSVRSSSKVKTLNKHIQVSLHKQKKSQNSNTLSKSKCHAVTMNEIKSEADLWEIKHDAIMKAEILENAKKLKVCLKKITLYDKNANIVNVCNKLKTSQIHNLNNLHKKTEDKNVSLTYSETVSNVECWEWNNSIINDDVTVKDKYDTHTNFNAYENRRKNFEHTDLKNLSHTTKSSSTTIISMTNMIVKGTPNAQISNTSSKQILKEKSTFLERNTKQDLILKKEAKDHDNFLNWIPCENVEQTREVPLTTDTSISPKNIIRLSMEKETLNEYENKGKILCSNDVEKDTDFLSFDMLQNRYPELNFQKVNLSKQKRVNSNQNIYNESTKKIKLNTSNRLQNFGTNHGNDNNDNVCDNTGNVIGSSSTETVPQMIITSVCKSNIIAQEKSNTDVQVLKKKSMKEEGILNLVEENQIANLGSTNKQDCDSLQNAWKSSEITSETHKSSAKDKFLVSGETNCNSETATDDVDEDIDCISLFADSTLMAEYDIPVTTVQPNSRNSLVRREKYYVMTDNVFENYYKSTTAEFNKTYDTTNVDNDKDTTSKENRKPLALRLNMPITRKEVSSLTKPFQNPQERETTKVVRNMFPTCFRGYCYRSIRTGKCTSNYNNQICQFKHEFVELMVQLYVRGEKYLFEVIDQLVSMNCVDFVKNVYEQIVVVWKDIICILKLFKRLYELNVATNKLAVDTIVVLERNAVSVDIVVNNLATIVGHDDSKFVNWIVKIIGNHITHHIRNGKYWDTLRALLLQVTNLEPEIIKIIIRECITTRKNVQDVHENIVIKLDHQVRSTVSQKLLLSFKNLLEYTNKNETIKQIEPLQSGKSISSPSVNNPINETESALTIVNKNSITITPKVWTEFPCKTKKRDDNNNAQNESSFLILHPLDDLPKPHSAYGREKFWKFYLDVHSLKEGLKHDDHNHVMQILNAANQKQKSLFSRACFQILCNEVKYSQYHLSKLVSLAVQIGATPVFYEILLDVAIHILARLAEEEFWVLAFKLLKDVEIVLQMRIRLQELDAVTILLFAEIYLANHKPVKAFTLLKRTNIICTNRSKWKARSNAKDDYMRAKVVALLLDRLCEMSPRHAIFLFQFLVTDQSSNFRPVDLTHSVNKVVSALLLKEDHELIINVGELIDNYNFMLNAITYRALIATLVHIDKHLAKQLYQNAVGLGIYSNIQFYPATYVIIHSDWTNEEMYLVILDLMQQLSLNIGHAIDHINLRQLSIYLIFENIPSEKQLACDRGANQQYDKRINESKTRLATVLQEQFDPPISIVKSKKVRGKLYKLQNISVRRYLQCEHLR